MTETFTFQKQVNFFQFKLSGIGKKLQLQLRYNPEMKIFFRQILHKVSVSQANIQRKYSHKGYSNFFLYYSKKMQKKIEKFSILYSMVSTYQRKVKENKVGRSAK